MKLIPYLKDKMNITRPYLFILSCTLSFGVGSGLMLIPLSLSSTKATRVLETEKARVVSLEKQILRKETEWQKRLKKATKTVTIRHPDGSEKIIETANEEADESGKTVISVEKLAQQLKLIEKKSETEFRPNWGVNLSVSPTGVDFGSYKNYNFSMSVERNIFNNFYLGPVVSYSSGRWYLGLSATYNF